jgi:histidinol-phosphate aminotransferase
MESIEKLVRKEVLALPEPKEVLGKNLSFGELPFAPAACKKAVRASVKRMNFYSDPFQRKLRRAIAGYCGVGAENVVAGNGGNEMIELVSKTFVGAGDKCVVVDPSYPVFAASSELMGGEMVRVPLKQDFSVDEESLLCAVAEAKVVWIASPNNPTGNELLTPRLVKRILSSFQGILIIDEIYFEYCGKTFAKLACRNPRVVVLRSLSKLGMAGAYLGYLIAAPQTARQVDKVRLAVLDTSANLFAQACGEALLGDEKSIAAMLRKFEELKSGFSSKLSAMGFEVLRSKSSFVLLRCKAQQEVLGEVARRGFRIKKSPRGLLSLRVPSRKEWPAVLAAFSKASVYEKNALAR